MIESKNKKINLISEKYRKYLVASKLNNKIYYFIYGQMENQEDILGLRVGVNPFKNVITTVIKGSNLTAKRMIKLNGFVPNFQL